MKDFIRAATMLLLITAPVCSFAQDSTKDSKLIEDCHSSRAAFTKTDSLMHSLFESAAAYAIFPNVGKGGIGVGGAAGNGILFENGQPVGKASMKQVNIGFQFGGQAYREVIFFENHNALNNFKQNNFEFSAQASAIAV